MDRAKRISAGGFTIIELLVVVSIIALLIGILLPAIGRARDTAQTTKSASNLRQIAIAHGNYGVEWNDNQWSTTPHNLAQFGNNYTDALDAWGDAGNKTGMVLAWSGDQVGVNVPLVCGPLCAINNNLYLPMGELAGNSGGGDSLFGYFRMMNIGSFNAYLTGRWYDAVLFAPKDKALIAAIGDCFDHPGEYCKQDPGPPGGPVTVYWTSYVLSPAALFNPSVMSYEFWEQNSDVWGNPGALRVPTYSQARHPDLKTHMLEHHWLQNPKADCHPLFQPGTYDGCEPYYFNHGLDSVPQTAFYDGHVAGVSARAAQAANNVAQAQGDGEASALWLDNTPLGQTGYLNNYAWPPGIGYVGENVDFLIKANTSFHILTRDGILGRDILTHN